MKTLRIVRNIAVLFIFVMALLASRPVPAVAPAAGFSCGFKPGYTNCIVDRKSGKCHESRCGSGSTDCLGIGCVF